MSRASASESHVRLFQKRYSHASGLSVCGARLNIATFGCPPSSVAGVSRVLISATSALNASLMVTRSAPIGVVSLMRPACDR